MNPLFTSLMRFVGAASGKLELSYSGQHQIDAIQSGGKTYEQWTFLTSGILTVRGSGKGLLLWLCGGGGGAGIGSTQYAAGGGAGAYCAFDYDLTLNQGSTIITIGGGGKKGTTAGAQDATPGGTTSFGDISALGGGPGYAGAGGNGGTGGGRALPAVSTGEVLTGMGDGISKIPFGDTVYFAGKTHCAGGAAGATGISANKEHMHGANGATNGGTSLDPVGTGGKNNPGVAGTGGAYGGGNGAPETGSGTNVDAYFYGGGGGGGNGSIVGAQSTQCGNGYQGVAYLRIPA